MHIIDHFVDLCRRHRFDEASDVYQTWYTNNSDSFNQSIVELFCNSVRYGNTELIRYLAELLNSIRGLNFSTKNSLVFACGHGFSETVNVIITDLANYHCIQDVGSGLEAAIFKGYIEPIKVLYTIYPDYIYSILKEREVIDWVKMSQIVILREYFDILAWLLGIMRPDEATVRLILDTHRKLAGEWKQPLSEMGISMLENYLLALD